MAYNIQQINTSMLKGATPRSAPLGFILPDNGEIPQYIVALTGKNIIKLGYCCEEKGHIFPIFLKMNGSYKEPIYIGKDGIYEMQQETFQDSNNYESEEEISNVIITEVMVPYGINFTLDYVTLTT